MQINVIFFDDKQNPSKVASKIFYLLKLFLENE